MREIGGYLELEHGTQPLFHERALQLNSGRNALAYLIEAKHIRRIAMPDFLCDACDEVLHERSVCVRRYAVDRSFLPTLRQTDADEWLYVVNYYGQLDSRFLAELAQTCPRLIVDNAQAFFQPPVLGADTLYTCRKFFGVPDGAFLYTDRLPGHPLEQDESRGRVEHLLGRLERTASEFYSAYTANEQLLSRVGVKAMSKLTQALLRSVDYEAVREKRTQNFTCLHNALKGINGLTLRIPEGAYMYPLYLENGGALRRKLQQEKIYLPTLWPAVLERCRPDAQAYDLAMNTLPLPVDQRYDCEDMQYLIRRILES